MNTTEMPAEEPAEPIDFVEHILNPGIGHQYPLVDDTGQDFHLHTRLRGTWYYVDRYTVAEHPSLRIKIANLDQQEQAWRIIRGSTTEVVGRSSPPPPRSKRAGEFAVRRMVDAAINRYAHE